MLTFLFALVLAYSEASADAAVYFYVSAPVEIPERLDPSLGAAIERFWRREELWQHPVQWDAERVRCELLWTRDRWPCPLPRIADAERLPTADDIAQGLSDCCWLCNRLDAIAEIAPPWEEDNLRIQRAEVSCYLNLCYSMRNARDGSNWLRQREALADVRRIVGDEAWFSGNWPSLFPFWLVRLTQ
jgi:hypothetical protein